LVAQTLKNDQQKSPKTISFIRVAALQSQKKTIEEWSGMPDLGFRQYSVG